MSEDKPQPTAKSRQAAKRRVFISWIVLFILGIVVGAGGYHYYTSRGIGYQKCMANVNIQDFSDAYQAKEELDKCNKPVWEPINIQNEYEQLPKNTQNVHLQPTQPIVQDESQ